MGMTIDIDESIKELSKWRKDLDYDNGDYFYGGDTTMYSLDVAIDTMRKYQKMQEILEKVWNIPSCMIDKAECLDKIMETYRTVRRQNE